MNEDEYLLLVEDDVPLGENIAELLADAGHVVVRCESAEQVLVRSDLFRCRGLITDVRLPGLSGIQLIEELRRRSFMPATMIMSALADGPVRCAALICGASRIMTKPVDLELLLAWAEHPH
jgi:DNA-binding response OmpR family regulator